MPSDAGGRNLADMRCGGALLLALLVTPSIPLAHEYWLDPVRSRLNPGERLEVDIRNGEDFVGSAYPFDPARFRILHRDGPAGRHAIDGRLGDYPALAVTLDRPGLHVVALSTGGQVVEYADFAEFGEFLRYHGLDPVARLHRERGLPEKRIVERYSRFAKTLVQVGDATEGGAERALAAQGLDFELLPAASPFLGRTTLEITLLIAGRALADAQVEVFHARADAAAANRVSRTTARTDDTGRVVVDIDEPGGYLINAVQLLTPRAGQPAHWRSIWTSLTFDIP